MYLSSASIILGALLCCSPLRMQANAAAMPHPNPQTFHHCLDPRKFYQFCCETIMDPNCDGVHGTGPNQLPPLPPGTHDADWEDAPPPCVEAGNCDCVPLEGSDQGHCGG